MLVRSAADLQTHLPYARRPSDSHGQRLRPPLLAAVGPGVALALLCGILGCKDKPAPPAPTTQKQAPPPPEAAPVAQLTPTEQGPHQSGALLDAGMPRDAGPEPAPFVAPIVVPPEPVTTDPSFTVTFSSAGIYAKPALDRELKIGYARSGGRVAILDEKVSASDCRLGWYKLQAGGFICSRFGTKNADSRQAKLAVSPPNLKAVLPYPYARNAKNGTPLYRSVPSRDQMLHYEPYLNEDAQRMGDAGTRPWWQQEDHELSQIQLAQLARESDGVLERRMVKGFYVAVDEEFEWSGRRWYKTTKGMVGPKDRFWAVEGSDFRGVELRSAEDLPIAWTYGYKKARPTYAIHETTKKVRNKGQLERLVPRHLSGKELTIGKRGYLQTDDGVWLRTAHVRVARMPPIPPDLAADERWIDVNLATQTLVALVGPHPIYATLVSSGKESDDPDKDHRTPTGEYRIREKHVTTTMDGDGTAAGDLPYSIEDVPYAMYFHGSYALHGAFWHRNYGARMSHGCVNLAPLDARYLFFFSEPTVFSGWHGAWAGNGQGSTRIVIRDPREGSQRRAN